MHNIYSACTSITSILIGIEIDKGFISDLDAPIIDWLPDYRDIQNFDPRKENRTIRHLLKMSSGLDCDDWYQFTESQMQKSADWVKFTLDLPTRYDPGTQGSYCTGGVVILGRIIENASGMSLEEFANRFLFGPLNIAQYQWHAMPDGRPSGRRFTIPYTARYGKARATDDRRWRGERSAGRIAAMDRAQQSNTDKVIRAV